MQHFRSVHAGHPLVQEDDVVGGGLQHFQGLRASLGRIRADGCFAQQAYGNLNVHARIVHHQDPCVGRTEGFGAPLCTGPIRGAFAADGADRFRGNDGLRQDDRKDGTFSVFAFHADGSAHQIQQVMGDGQAEACAFHRAVPVQIHPLEFCEEFRDIFLPDADARIPDGDFQRDFSAGGVVLLKAAHPEGHRTFVGIFQRVAEKIGDDLAHADLVTVKGVGDGTVHIQPVLQSLFPGTEGDHAADIIQEGGELIAAFGDFHFSGFDFGEIEDIVDDGQQIGTGLFYIGRIV